MELSGAVVVVTGGASGIGRALARRAHAEGARVVVADRDVEGVEAVAAELGATRPASALGLACNVAVDVEVAGLVARTEEAFGPIDLFCANAGVALGTDPVETPDADWATAIGVNVMAHVYAARHLLPGWLERGSGYFLSTASAAGLLTQIGSAPYAVTKHGAVAFAEWLSITYGDRGIKVSCLCPQGVDTPMLRGGLGSPTESLGANVVTASGGVLQPEDVAGIVVEALREERFLVLPHPEVLTYLQRKTSDYDRWLAGMRRLQARMAGA